MKSKFLLSLCVIASAQALVTAKDKQVKTTPITKPEAPVIKKADIQAPKPEAPVTKKPAISEIITNDITTATALAAALRKHGYTSDANQLDVLKVMTLPNLINAIKSNKHGLSPELAAIIQKRNEGKSAPALLKALNAFKK